MLSVSTRVFLVTLFVTLGATLLSGCTAADDRSTAVTSAANAENTPLSNDSYYLEPSLESWIDPDSGYDTAREWSLDGGTWPICTIMSPSQSPQAIVAERDGLMAEALEPLGITPTFEGIDLPPRTFHALQRSKWPFVYMPLGVFTDYCRTNENQGDAGGLQYVALAGSTAGGGYTLLSKDPEVKSVADLADKSVAQANANPVPGTLLAAAAKQVGLELGDGPGQIHLVRSEAGNQLNDYEAGKIDAVISLNIVKAPLIARGSHAVTDFSDVRYTPNYTILCVERSVLEERPEVVQAFLEAHYEANAIAQKEWDSGLKTELMRGWNEYFASQGTELGKQRIAASQAAFDAMLGDMYPEQRIDPALLQDCFDFTSANGLWGWDGAVDTERLSALHLYDSVLDANGEPSQSEGDSE